MLRLLVKLGRPFAQDVERSVRYFAKDGAESSSKLIVLSLSMCFSLMPKQQCADGPLLALRVQDFER